MGPAHSTAAPAHLIRCAGAFSKYHAIFTLFLTRNDAKPAAYFPLFPVINMTVQSPEIEGSLPFDSGGDQGDSSPIVICNGGFGGAGLFAEIEPVAQFQRITGR